MLDVVGLATLPSVVARNLRAAARMVRHLSREAESHLRARAQTYELLAERITGDGPHCQARRQQS
jgi:hypothetical protein